MSDEEIAREAAKALITVQPYEPNDGDFWVCIGRHEKQSGEHSLYHDQGDAEYDRDIYRNNAVPFILAAIEKARRQFPAESPVQPVRMKAIREQHESQRHHYSRAGQRAAVADLLAHIDHLERLVGWLSVERDCDMVSGLVAMKGGK